MMMKLSSYAKGLIAAGSVGGTFFLARRHFQDYTNISSNNISNLGAKNGTIIEDLPEKIPFLLIGGGTASHSAMRAIRGHDPEARVLIVTNENYTPYMRPALSKELWLSDKNSRSQLKFKWYNNKDKSIFFEEDEFYLPLNDMLTFKHGGVSLIKNMSLTKIDPNEKIAFFNNGQSLKYDKCLLAPGGKPKSLAQLDAAPQEVKDRTLYFRTANDFLKLDTIAETSKSIAIIGGGLLGTELVFALRNRAHEGAGIRPSQTIFQIYPEAGNLAKILPGHLSEYVTKVVIDDGGLPIPNVEILEVTWNSKQNLIDILLSNGQIVSVSHIVAAVGLEPDVDLARDSKLEVDDKTGGYLVNAELEARTDVWVSGDACSYYDTLLGRRRVEHHDHAVNSGRLAGQNMVGAKLPYTHQSMFWSDLSDYISFEAVGLIDSSLPTVAVFTKEDEEGGEKEKENEEPKTNVNEKLENINANSNMKQNKNKNTTAYDRGVVFYLKEDVIVGVLMWNLFSRLNIARRIINEQKKYDDLSELAKLFNIHLQDE